jgi:hypothetical protein
MTGASLHDCQKQTFDTMYGGFKRGQLMTFDSGRGTGKSMLAASAWAGPTLEIDSLAMLTPLPPFEVLSTADVDGAPWYTVSCRKEVPVWIRENGEEGKEWYSHIHIDSKWMTHRNVFDMSQEMFAMVKLRWGT